MIGAFKQKSPWQQPLIIFLAFATKLIYIVSATGPVNFFDPGGLLVPFLNHKAIPKFNSGFLNLLSIGLLLISALYANSVLASAKMFNRQFGLVAVSMILVTGLFPAANLELPIWILMPLIIYSVSQVMQLYKSDNPTRVILNIGFATGLLYILYHPFIFFIPAVFTGLLIMRPFSIRELMMLLLSILTPLYFALAYNYVFGYWDPLESAPNFDLYILPWITSYHWYISIATAGILLLIGFTNLERQLHRTVISGRKGWQFMLILPIFLIPLIIIPSGNHFAAFATLSFPAAALAANAFIPQPTNFRQRIMFWMVILVLALAAFAWRSGSF